VPHALGTPTACSPPQPIIWIRPKLVARTASVWGQTIVDLGYFLDGRPNHVLCIVQVLPSLVQLLHGLDLGLEQACDAVAERVTTRIRTHLAGRSPPLGFVGLEKVTESACDLETERRRHRRARDYFNRRIFPKVPPTCRSDCYTKRRVRGNTANRETTVVSPLPPFHQARTKPSRCQCGIPCELPPCSFYRRTIDSATPRPEPSVSE
jgi:hypothetical protein